MEHSLPKLIKDQFLKSHEIRLSHKEKKGIAEEEKTSMQEELNKKLKFWEMSEPELDSFLFDSIAELVYCFDDEELQSLPRPYRSLILAMEFELTTQSDGWVALSNHGQDLMREIAEAYRIIGLPDVANGLLEATHAYSSQSEVGSEEFYSALTAAYSKHVKVEYGFDEDYETRMPKIISYARKIPTLVG